MKRINYKKLGYNWDRDNIVPKFRSFLKEIEYAKSQGYDLIPADVFDDRNIYCVTQTDGEIVLDPCRQSAYPQYYKRSDTTRAVSLNSSDSAPAVQRTKKLTLAHYKKLGYDWNKYYIIPKFRTFANEIEYAKSLGYELAPLDYNGPEFYVSWHHPHDMSKVTWKSTEYPTYIPVTVLPLPDKLDYKELGYDWDSNYISSKFRSFHAEVKYAESLGWKLFPPTIDPKDNRDVYMVDSNGTIVPSTKRVNHFPQYYMPRSALEQKLEDARQVVKDLEQQLVDNRQYTISELKAISDTWHDNELECCSIAEHEAVQAFIKFLQSDAT